MAPSFFLYYLNYYLHLRLKRMNECQQWSSEASHRSGSSFAGGKTLQSCNFGELTLSQRIAQYTQGNTNVKDSIWKLNLDKEVAGIQHVGWSFSFTVWRQVLLCARLNVTHKLTRQSQRQLTLWFQQRYYLDRIPPKKFHECKLFYHWKCHRVGMAHTKSSLVCQITRLNYQTSLKDWQIKRRRLMTAIRRKLVPRIHVFPTW